MINVLIFLWIFIIPISSFVWGLFYKNTEELPKLNPKEIKEVKKFFWGSPLTGILALTLSLLALDNFDFSKFLDSLHMFFHQTHILIFWEILFFDIMSFTFLHRKSYSFLPQKGVDFFFIRKNWGWYKAYLLFNPIYLIFYVFLTMCFAVTLSPVVSKIFILTYPFGVYFRTKDLYAIFLFCKQEHYEKKHKFNVLTKKGKTE